jgi:hypothetical protein
VSPVKYEQGFYIPKYGILLSIQREDLMSYTSVLTCGKVYAGFDISFFLNFFLFV